MILTVCIGEYTPEYAMELNSISRNIVQITLKL